jgi:hypothetical protein
VDDANDLHQTLLYSWVGSAFQVNAALRFKHSLSIYGGGEGEKIGESSFCCLGPRIAPPCLIRERNAFKQLALVACVYASHVSRTTFFLRHPWFMSSASTWKDRHRKREGLAIPGPEIWLKPPQFLGFMVCQGPGSNAKIQRSEQFLCPQLHAAFALRKNHQMVGAGSRNNDVLASQFDIHIFGLCHKPLRNSVEPESRGESTFKTRPEGKFKRRTSTGRYHGSFVKLVRDKPVVEVVEFETTDPALRGEGAFYQRPAEPTLM